MSVPTPGRVLVYKEWTKELSGSEQNVWSLGPKATSQVSPYSILCLPDIPPTVWLHTPFFHPALGILSPLNPVPFPSWLGLLSPGMTASSSFSSTSAQATCWARRWACRRLPRSLRRLGLPPALCSSGSRDRGWATRPAATGCPSLCSGSWPAVGKRGTMLLSSSPTNLMAREQHPGSLILFLSISPRFLLPTAQSPNFQITKDFTTQTHGLVPLRSPFPS